MKAEAAVPKTPGDQPMTQATGRYDGPDIVVSRPSLPCGCPLDSGCDGYHAIEER